MKNLGEFLIVLIVITLSSLISWVSYNNVTYLFPSLPAAWKHLDFWTVFCLTWLIRNLSNLLRNPDIKIKTTGKEE